MSANDSRIPSKVLSANVAEIRNVDTWPYDDGTPWWSGGTTPQPYTYELVLEIFPQTHSSNLTREPYQYNGLDVFKNSWIGEGSTGSVYLITEVLEKNEDSATIRVEDKYRYNIFKDPAQNGNGSPLPGLFAIFDLSEEGMPLIDPYPTGTLSVDAFAAITSGRFRRFNTARRVELQEPNHDFVTGDVISVTNSGYERTTSGNAAQSFGRVVEADSNPVTFSVTSNSKLIQSTQRRMPGDLGDFLYADPALAGSLSDQKNGPALYLRISDAVTSMSAGTAAISTANINVGDTLEINRVSVVFTGTDPSTIESDINALSDDHGVVASLTLAETTSVSNISDTAFGGIFMGASPPGQASINGTTVVFSTTTSGGSYGNANDVATDINNANIPNISATAGGGLVTIINSTGGAIEIVNLVNESFGNPVAGGGSGTGLPLITPASSDGFLTLSDPDGLSIILRDIVGTPKVELGLVSVDNGLPVFIMPISEAGTTQTGGVIVVPDIPTRDGLLPAVGQQVYVVDADDGQGNKAGEWALYIWDGSTWVKTADQDSASTDANTFELTLNTTSSASEIIGTVSDNSRVTLITVEVITAFDGTPSLDIGITGDSDALMSDDILDLTSEGTYATTTDQLFTGGDTDIITAFNNAGSTVGEAKIIISYQ